MNLMKRIEELRQELEKLGAEKGFQDVEVIKVSQRLDELINRYYRATLTPAKERLAG